MNQNPAGVAVPGTAGHPIRVLIADDQALVRNGFKLLLSSYPYLDVVGEASNGLEAVERARQLMPDVLLMDIRMPVLDGIEATKRLLSDPVTSQCKVLILTTFDLDEYVYDALAAGASGFMLKDNDPDELVDAIRVVARGEALLAPSVTRRLIERFVRPSGSAAGRQATNAPAAAPSRVSPEVASLTDREREVLIAVAKGLSNQGIADKLVISPATAKTHVGNIMAKLNAHDRAQLVIAAYENGLVRPGEQD